MTLEQRKARAIAVRGLLDDPNIQMAFAEIRRDLTAEWRRSFTVDERENVWRAVNIMDRLEAWLRAKASDGLSSAELTALRRAGSHHA